MLRTTMQLLHAQLNNTRRAKYSSPLKNFVNNFNIYRELLYKILYIS